jgi:hypothetical protein
MIIKMERKGREPTSTKKKIPALNLGLRGIPEACLEVRCSIQLSYWRSIVIRQDINIINFTTTQDVLAKK